MKSNIATFIGNNNCSEISIEQIRNTIMNLILRDVTYFISSGTSNFERICAKNVFQLKKDFPQINNILILPYRNYRIVNPNYFDKIIYYDEYKKLPHKSAILRCSRYIIQNSEYAVCNMKHCSHSSIKSYQYAIINNLTIVNL